MEANCCIIFDMPNQTLRNKTADFLTEDSRPIFDDEVEPDYRDLFNALEYTEYPEDLRKVSDKTIHAYFFMGGNFDEDVHYFFNCLHKAGALHAIAAVDADDYEGLIYLDDNGNLNTLGNEYRKIMKFIDVTDDEDLEEDETIEDDLADTYNKLEQIKEKLLSA